MYLESDETFQRKTSPHSVQIFAESWCDDMDLQSDEAEEHK